MYQLTDNLISIYWCRDVWPVHTLLLEALCTDCYNLGDAVNKEKTHSVKLSEECVQYISTDVLDLIIIGNKPTRNCNNTDPNFNNLKAKQILKLKLKQMWQLKTIFLASGLTSAMQNLKIVIISANPNRMGSPKPCLLVKCHIEAVLFIRGWEIGRSC